MSKSMTTEKIPLRRNEVLCFLCGNKIQLKEAHERRFCNASYDNFFFYCRGCKEKHTPGQKTLDSFLKIKKEE